MLTRTKYSGKAPLVVGAALAAAVLMALLPLAGCDTNSGSGGNTTTQQSGTGTSGTGGNTGTSGGGTSTGGGTTGSGTGENVGTGPSQPATPATYTVTFNANGGSEVASQTVESGTAATEPTAPTRYSDKFLGWYPSQTAATPYDFNAKVTAGITLYAKWQVAAINANTQAVVVAASGTRTEYDDVTNALTTASGSAGSTVYLVQDITVTSLVEISSGTFTLDLNGKTVSADVINALFQIAPIASLTVTDSSGLGGSLSAHNCEYVIYNNGTVTVDRITISASNVSLAAVGNSGNLTVNGGTISSGDYAVQNSGTMAVAGGTITASRGAGVVNFPGSTLTVTGGTISSSSTDDFAVANEGTLTVSGGSISSSSSTGAVRNGGGTMTVSGGAIMGSGTGTGVALISGTLKLSGTPVITGGSGNPGLSLSSPITLTGALTGDTTYSVDLYTNAVAQSDGVYAITAADAQKFFSYQDANVKGTLSGTGTAATVVFQ